MTANKAKNDLKLSTELNGVVDSLVTASTKGGSLTEDDIQSYYDTLVESQKSDYANDVTYNSDRNGGELIVYNPEGYRAVKQVLIKFDDDQSTRYSELTSTLSTLNDELEAATTPAEEAADDTADTAETVESRPVEDIVADIAEINGELDALYAELMPEVNEVIDAFNAGTTIQDLIDQYNDDPGMQQEPTVSQGYAVSETSTTWDPSFTAGAMSIAEPGQLSDPIQGSYGIYIIYYDHDIVSGPVALDEVRDSIAQIVESNLKSDAYSAALTDWMAEADPQYFLDNMK